MEQKQLNKVGDLLEAALWFNADKPGEDDKAKEGIVKAMLHTEDGFAIELGPVDFNILKPGDERVPTPPVEYAGRPQLMVGTAKIVKVGRYKESTGEKFTDVCDKEDLAKLRQATQRQWFAANRGSPPLTQAQLDDVINEVGPDTALKQLSKVFDARVLH